jgi:hypothetical protein
VAHKSHIERETRHHSERPPDGSVNPFISIAKSASAQEGEQNDVRRAALLIQNGRQHRRFVGSLQNQRREWFPMRRRYTAVSHGKGGAEGLRDNRPLFPVGIGDLYIGVDPDTKLAAQSIHLAWWQPPEERRNGVKPRATAQCIAVAIRTIR